MTTEEMLFNEIGESIQDSIKGQLFGKKCFKINGKAFICFFENEMVFKLPESIRELAIQLPGSQLFDPSKKQRPMKEWVQVSYVHNKKWLNFAEESSRYVSSLQKSKFS